jgi:hypothetical protein
MAQLRRLYAGLRNRNGRWVAERSPRCPLPAIPCESSPAWLFGTNPRLGDRRPIDLIRAGRAEELGRAIRADSFA